MHSFILNRYIYKKYAKELLVLLLLLLVLLLLQSIASNVPYCSCCLAVLHSMCFSPVVSCQVVILHHILSKATVKTRPSVLWCYKKELGFSRCAWGCVCGGVRVWKEFWDNCCVRICNYRLTFNVLQMILQD